MPYHVLLVVDGRPHPLYLSQLDAPDDAEARRLVAETWLQAEPELRLPIVRQDDEGRLTWLPDEESAP